MIKMNWYLVSIDKKNKERAKEINIAETIYNEFKSKGINEKKTVSGKLSAVYASNQSILSSQFEFEKIYIIGDITIHNKSEIIKKYRFDSDTYSYNDNHFFNEMYEMSGIDAIADLVGEFSFVLFEKETETIHAARDQLGVKTIFWIENENQFIFSSDIFLLTKYFDLNDINESYFEEYYYRDGLIDICETPFNPIKRISSGNYLKIKNNQVSDIKYWDLVNVKQKIIYKENNEYYEKFKQTLLLAVESRLKLTDQNCVLLSGGLDSTSIYALSNECESLNHKYNVTSTSAVFNELKECDEREYIEELLMKYNKNGDFINYDNKLMFEEFPNNIPFAYEPNVNSITYEFTAPLIESSVEKGYSNILSGFGGDQLLEGTLYTARDYLNKMQIKKALSTITEYSIYTNSSAFKNTLNYLLFPDIAKGYIANNSNYLKEMRSKLKRIDTFNQRDIYYQITNAKAHLYMDRVIGAIYGADIHHPFLDRRLIEFVYTIPGELRFDSYMSKIILRKSMSEVLTNNIVNKVNKTTHLTYIYKSLRTNWPYISNSFKDPIVVNRLKLTTKDDWEKGLLMLRNGLETPPGFWTLISIEIWFLKLEEKRRG